MMEVRRLGMPVDSCSLATAVCVWLVRANRTVWAELSNTELRRSRRSVVLGLSSNRSQAVPGQKDWRFEATHRPFRNRLRQPLSVLPGVRLLTDLAWARDS